jgi:hypothetical protein
MRQRFEQQFNLLVTTISDVKITLKSRDELAPMLAALQHVFVTPSLNERIFSLLESNTSCTYKTDQSTCSFSSILL